MSLAFHTGITDTHQIVFLPSGSVVPLLLISCVCKILTLPAICILTFQRFHRGNVFCAGILAEARNPISAIRSTSDDPTIRAASLVEPSPKSGNGRFAFHFASSGDFLLASSSGGLPSSIRNDESAGAAHQQTHPTRSSKVCFQSSVSRTKQKQKVR